LSSVPRIELGNEKVVLERKRLFLGVRQWPQHERHGQA
jgi:hypothetical protein